MSEETPTVLVSVITREHIFAGTAKWLLTCGYEVDLVHTYAPIVQNRNIQAQRFYENTQFDYIFFLDSDTIPAAGTVESLLDATLAADNAPIGCPSIHAAPGWANMPGYPPYPAAYLEVPDKVRVYKPAAEGPGIPTIVDACGMSGALVHRSVFEVMDYPWFHGHTDLDGNWLSEDFQWFAEAKRLGYQVVAHLDLIADHHKPVSLAAVRAAVVPVPSKIRLRP